MKWRTELTSVSPILNIHSVTVATISQNTLCILLFTVHKDKRSIETQSMIGFGAGGTFINYAKNFETKLLDQPIIAKNVNRTVNKKKTIKSYVDLELKIGLKNFKEQFYVTGLGKQRIILGFPWLRKHNPKIDWNTGKIEWELQKLDFRKWCGKKENPELTIEEKLDKEERKIQTINPIKEEVNTILLDLMDKTIDVNKINIATELAIEENRKKEEKTDE